jgi:hypothetical protein
MRQTATSTGSACDAYMYMESSQIAPLAGRTVTLSLKVRRNATFNADVALRIDKSATVDAGSGATWTNITPSSGSNGTSNFDTNASITTGTGASDWTTIYRTISIPNDGTANSLRIIVYYGAVVPNGSVLDIAQLQLEIGSVVTSFSRAGGTIQGELSACQRYYETGRKELWSGNTTNASAYALNVRFAVTKRTTSPTVTIVSSYLIGFPSIAANEIGAQSFRIAGTSNSTASGSILGCEEWNASAEL